MKYLAAIVFALTLASLEYCKAQTSGTPVANNTSGTSSEQPRRPKINWGKCPQLEPTEKDIEFKSNILQECLKQNPPPMKDVTQEMLLSHQRDVTECALKIENWFDSKGQYKFDKAEKEIRNKRLSKDMEQALLQSHQHCANVARDHSNQSKEMSVVEQVQMYQACMDAHITQHCQIQIGA